MNAAYYVSPEESLRVQAERGEAARAAREWETRWLAADIWEGRVRPRCRVCGARHGGGLIRRCAWCGARREERL